MENDYGKSKFYRMMWVSGRSQGGFEPSTGQDKPADNIMRQMYLRQDPSVRFLHEKAVTNEVTKGKHVLEVRHLPSGGLLGILRFMRAGNEPTLSDRGPITVEELSEGKIKFSISGNYLLKCEGEAGPLTEPALPINSIPQLPAIPLPIVPGAAPLDDEIGDITGTGETTALKPPTGNTEKTDGVTDKTGTDESSGAVLDLNPKSKTTNLENNQTKGRKPNMKPTIKIEKNATQVILFVMQGVADALGITLSKITDTSTKGGKGTVGRQMSSYILKDKLKISPTWVLPHLLPKGKSTGALYGLAAVGAEMTGSYAEAIRRITKSTLEMIEEQKLSSDVAGAIEDGAGSTGKRATKSKLGRPRKAQVGKPAEKTASLPADLPSAIPLPSGLNDLPVQEVIVFVLINLGKTAERVAAKLSLTLDQVYKSVGHVCDKLGDSAPKAMLEIRALNDGSDTE